MKNKVGSLFFNEKLIVAFREGSTMKKVYTKEEALKNSTDYFGGNSLAAEVFVNKYALRNDKLQYIEDTPEKMHHRIAEEFSRIEKKYPSPISEKEIFELLRNFKYVIPQGSPMFGIGNPYQNISLSNCFVIDTVDSYGGICRTDERIAQVSKRRGGCVEHNSFVNIENKGVVKIKDVDIGDKILSYNISTKKSEYQIIQDKYYTNVKKENQIKIILKNGFEIRTSKTHPVLILKDGKYVYVKAGELKQEDICIIPEKNDMVLNNLLDYNNKRKFSRTYHLTEEEKNSILSQYEKGRYDRRSEKNKKRINMMAIIALLKKNNRLGFGGLNVLKEYGFFDDTKEKEILQRAEVEEIVVEKEDLQYVDLSVKGNNNYYAGSRGLINIHNCGVDISSLRPKGQPTRNSAFTTDGIVVFMQRFSNTSREVAQSGRRGALMISISVHHPEILNFIKAKIDLEQITGSNISVKITDEFMDAVKKNKKYELRWPVDSKKPSVSFKIDALTVWNEIIRCAHKSGEPGVLFWDTIIRNSPADCYSDVGFNTSSTNPCVTGDTKVYTADGRGSVPISQLANEGKDVQVFCYDSSNNVVIRTMRNPRRTGYSNPIYKVTLDDGSIIRCTGNHKLLTTTGYYKRADELEKGDSLRVLTKYEASLKDIFEKDTVTSQDYFWINNGFKTNHAEHRVIASHFYGKIKKGHVVHHLDRNSKNNSVSNLIVLKKEDHDSLHSKDMIGDKNPMRRAKTEWSKEKWKKYRRNMSEAVRCEKNGRFSGCSNNAIEEHAIKLTRSLNRRFSKKEWQEYARKNKLPIAFSKWRRDNLGTLLAFSKSVAQKCSIEYIEENPQLVRTLQSMIEQGYDAFIDHGCVLINKKCKSCGRKLIVDHLKREISFCSIKCACLYRNKHGFLKKMSMIINDVYEKKAKKTMEKQLDAFTMLKFSLNRVPYLDEWKEKCKGNGIPFRLGTKHGFKTYNDIKESSLFFNHRVVSVEFEGHEDVYNGTVDDFHNFFVGGFESQTKNGKRKWIYINNLNCGELPTAPQTSCILMLLNLASYVLNPFTDKASFNVDLFKKHVGMAQKLLDDIVDLEVEAISRIIKKIKKDPEDKKTKENELSLWTEIKDKCEQSRRTGLGLTALGDCIAMLGVKYGSKESISVVKNIYSTLRDEAYRSSIQMAKDRGAFPIFNFDKEKNNEYLNRLPNDIKSEMKKCGRRNIACLTTSPAGSVSTIASIGDFFGTSSGFEPVFKVEYKRKRKLTDSDNSKDKPDFVDAMGDKWKEYTIMHSGLKLFKSITGKGVEDSPYNGSQAEELDYRIRVEMQAMATEYTDHAISSTINLPKDVDVDTVSSLYMDAWAKGCKGLTVYRSGSRDGVLTEINTTRECEDCDEASKDLIRLIEQGKRPSRVILATAPKRPEIVECDIHRSKVDKGDWLFFVGHLNGHPYEVFGGNSQEFTIPHKYKKGWICKNGKHNGVTQYNLVLGSLEDENEKLEVKGIAKHFNNYQYGAFTRLTSLAMRHGTPIKYICEQITKRGVEGELFSFQRAMARVLKKYIAEGEKSEIECPECHSRDLVYKNGCPTCQICGHSNCS